MNRFQDFAIRYPFFYRFHESAVGDVVKASYHVTLYCPGDSWEYSHHISQGSMCTPIATESV